MTMLHYRDCPGCGVRLLMSEEQPDSRYNASPECWQLYGELTAYTVTRGDVAFMHQHAVDTYGAQHAGEQARPITVAFALIGLYLACEQDYSGKKVQHMHMLLARRTKTWPPFTPPALRGSLTVLDVLRAPPGEQRDHMLRQWRQSVWDAWSQEHARVRALLESVMRD
ncbi:MAG: hypothetical protein OJF49_003424 [Ktedonobacterales bacterium]|nr:MAG: hypothetical protein OJF49_003424 [Ktedonobacterales bacterium]